MIPRTLVPPDARPPALESSTRRRPSELDERTLVPSMLPIAPLETKSNIPANLPLEAIAARVVVPRDVKQEAYGVRDESALPPQPTSLDERTIVPVGAAPPEVILPPEKLPTDLVESDIFTTGEVNLIPEPPKSDKDSREELITKISSFLVHAALIALIILQPKLFKRHEPTAEEQEIARKQMTLLLPPGAFELNQPAPRPVQPHPPAPKVNPRVLREIAPPTPVQPTPVPQPQPQPKAQDLPSAPTPQQNAQTPPPSAPAPKQEIASNSPLKLETPDTPQPKAQLVLPKNSTSSNLRDAIRDAAKNSGQGGRSGAVSGPIPKGMGGGDIPGQGSPGLGSFGNGYSILTPTEGVDFSDYMQRVLASVRRNWYAVMPQSAMLGDRGRVVLEFSIRKDGSVPNDDPQRAMTSGKEPLDRAAISAIRSSNPFEPLPPAFSGPEIRLRFIFLYNLPLDSAYQ